MTTTTASDIYLIGQHVAQIGLSIYGFAVSFGAITRLQKYEETSKKLAEWSKEAETQLHKTQTTQTSGTVAVFGSLIISVILATLSLPKSACIVLPAGELVLVLFARWHMQKFWAPKDGKTVKKVIALPQMDVYNEAMGKTESLLQVLEYMEYSWLISTLLNALIR